MTARHVAAVIAAGIIGGTFSYFAAVIFEDWRNDQ